MFNPEFYLAEYKVKSLVDGSIRTVTGRLVERVLYSELVKMDYSVECTVFINIT